ncbi:Glycosyl transferase family 2 [Roseivivax lentus]|uniref:Glycosyl transferase family 2 n=1 Tax=Roseivivax lentus TaxID=633194 RepID=A0A1N7PQJ5_9RHOB|nr:glycosyltransferase family 2 protein [Roseivivax lentus]SIT12709.1 Glycosyl transferase family 2 [Roseivivax lentus]
MAQNLTMAAILKEPVDTVRGFIAYHRAQGVTRFHLCFDDPDDPAVEGLGGAPDVIAERGTPDFWARVGIGADKAFPMRQNHFLTYAYHAAPVGWFAALDGDEYFHLDGRTLAEELDAQEPETVAVTIRSAEHVQTPQDGACYHFRLPQPRWLRQALYSNLAGHLRTREGFAGHIAGKSCTRTGLGSRVRIRQHWAAVEGRDLIAARIMTHEDGAHLLHFVDRGFANWRAKLDWRLSSRGYVDRMKTMLLSAMEADAPEAELWKIYAELHVFGPERLQVLSDAGRLLSVPVAEIGREASGLDRAA